MVYIDAHGNAVNKKPSLLAQFLSFIAFIILFFKTLLGISPSRAEESDNREHLRRGGNSGGGGGFSGNGGNGGPGGDGGMRRPIGRLPRSSGMKMGGCAGGSCGM